MFKVFLNNWFNLYVGLFNFMDKVLMYLFKWLIFKFKNLLIILMYGFRFNLLLLILCFNSLLIFFFNFFSGNSFFKRIENFNGGNLLYCLIYLVVNIGFKI